MAWPTLLQIRDWGGYGKIREGQNKGSFTEARRGFMGDVTKGRRPPCAA